MLISYCTGGSVLLSIFSRSIKKFLQQIEKTYAVKDELNLILENLEESIMIVSVLDYKADFINQRFL